MNDDRPGGHAGPFFYLVAAVVLVVDQITKLRIAGSMSLHQSERILGDFFQLTYVHNDGAAFGLDLGGRWAFIAVTIVVSAFIVFYYARSERTPMARWALALILGGALGNLADRIRLGEVIDFLHVSVAGFSWPIFNVADIGVSVGVGLLALHLFRKEIPEDVDEAPDPIRRLTVRIRPEAAGRLDRALARELTGSHSRTELARLIREGRVLLHGAPAKPRTMVCAGDVVVIDLPEPEPSDLAAEDLPIRIRWEDDRLAVVDKPAGMVTHPAGPLRTGTLVNALLAKLGGLSGVGGVLRPGIVHRLDKGTSGLLVVAKDDETHRRLADQLRDRSLRRTYDAVAWGSVTPARFTIDEPVGRHPRDRKRMAVVVGGREARSHVAVRTATELASRLEIRLETGRTHQIRVHLRHRRHPLVGDATYGGRRHALRGVPGHLRGDAEALLARIDRPALHSRLLELTHPFTGESIRVESPLPEDYRAVVDLVEGRSPRDAEIR